ncbi:MAG: hypothetical protein ACE5JS_09190 [Nitrospinota bacterium]
MPTKGFDFFIAEAGSKGEYHCGVCNTKCEVKRNVYGPTTFAEAMAKTFRYHDLFVCPHRDEKWHEQALNLVQAIEETPSRRVAQLMAQDLEDLLRENGISK